MPEGNDSRPRGYETTEMPKNDIIERGGWVTDPASPPPPLGTSLVGSDPTPAPADQSSPDASGQD